MVQAAFGGLLVRHSGRPDDLALDTRPAIRRLLAAAVACGLIGGLLRMVGELAWSSDPTLRPGTLLLVRAVADAASVVIGLPVLIASLAVAYFAFVQADATQKMQTGGVMPFVTFGTSNGDEEGNQDIALTLTNNRVGPAILGPIEIRYQG